MNNNMVVKIKQNYKIINIKTRKKGKKRKKNQMGNKENN